MAVDASDESEASESPFGATPASGETVAIARRLALSAKGVIGFLPVTRTPPDAHGLLLDALAAALIQFVSGEVAVVGDWRAWSGEPEPEPESDPDLESESEARLESSLDIPRASRGKGGARRVRRVSLPPVPDRARASIELRKLLAGRSGNASRLLVNLAEYARPGVIPATLEWMEGVALLVPVRRARWKRVAALVRGIAPERQLGAILVE